MNASNHRAYVEQVYIEYRVSSTFAWWLLDRVNGVLYTVVALAHCYRYRRVYRSGSWICRNRGGWRSAVGPVWEWYKGSPSAVRLVSVRTLMTTGHKFVVAL